MNKENTTEAIRRLLKLRHGRGWLLFHELRTGVGYDLDSERYIDLFAMQVWHNDRKKTIKYDRIAYEIKVSRSDFLADRRDPFKQRPAILNCTHFYWVAPEGLIKLADLPLDTGLLEYTAAGKLRQTVASVRFDFSPNWAVIGAIPSRIFDGAFTIAGGSGKNGNRIEQIRAELKPNNHAPLAEHIRYLLSMSDSKDEIIRELTAEVEEYATMAGPPVKQRLRGVINRTKKHYGKN